MQTLMFLYGSKSWLLIKEQMRRIEMAEINFQKSSGRVQNGLS
jgi:hypothetical protein